MLISESYRALNADLHATDPEFGSRGDKWATRVAQVAHDFQCSSVLDYGCGKGPMAIASMTVAGYDPAIPEFAGEPVPADLVVCTDVLEHVEPECLQMVLANIRFLALRAAFLVVATRPAKKILGDGRNAHAIVRPLPWWLEQFAIAGLTVDEANDIGTRRFWAGRLDALGPKGFRRQVLVPPGREFCAVALP